ncbi:MAG: type IV toxin-antitoxin system AbiEi family antitoxin domain-containing protein [Bacilli bacterium]|nr:type IV toxin-antitoxin system AbiEi family antitoxin domain-containing protein [Bacilli bacterium]
MITNELLDFIYAKNLNRETITAKELLKLGLNYSDISKLVENNVIKRIKRGIYGLDTYDDLFNYVIYLINQEKYYKAYKILLKCHEENPDNLTVLEYLFLCSINTKTSTEIKWNILEKIIKISTDKRKNLNNVYLYFLTYKYLGVKKEYIEIIKSLKYGDLKLFDDTSINLQNSTAYNIEKVIDIIGNIEENEYLTTYQKKIIKELMQRSLKVKEILNKKLLQLVEEENYQKIIDILKPRKGYIHLDFEHEVILLLANKIIEIISKDQIPSPIVKENCRKNMLAMIENNYFEKAYSFSSQCLKTSNKVEDIIINLMLNKIIKITSKESQSKRINEVFRFSLRNPNVENIILNLIDQNIEGAITETKNYLRQLGEEQYEYLVLNLFDIYYKDGENNYQNLIIILTEISQHEYVYNITTFLELFYKSLNSNKIEEAETYMKIIEKYTPKVVNIIGSLEKDIEKAKNRTNEEKQFIKNYLLAKVSKMKENNISAIILDPVMPHSLRTTIYKTIKCSPIKELRAFSIGEEPKYIVLRYLNPNNNDKLYQQPDYQELYVKKQYQECIDIIKSLLENPRYGGYNAAIYAYLGLSYYHTNNLEEAIKYIRIANGLNKETNLIYEEAYDFEELLSQMNIQFKNTEVSPEDETFQMLVTNALRRSSINITSRKEKNIYQELEEFAYYLKEEKINLSEAYSKYYLSEEDIQIITLIYVKDYYTVGMYKEGDSLLHQVEKNKNKTAYVRELIDETRKNKLFYKHRIGIYTRKKILN